MGSNIRKADTPEFLIKIKVEIEQFLQNKNLTKLELAKLMKVSSRSVRFVLNTDLGPSFSFVQKYCNMRKIKLSDYFKMLGE